jgi:hypothetical protein
MSSAWVMVHLESYLCTSRKKHPRVATYVSYPLGLDEKSFLLSVFPLAQMTW